MPTESQNTDVQPYIGKVEMTPAGDAKYAFGTQITTKVSEYVPLTPRYYWSAFDNYLELQKALTSRGTPILDTTPGKPSEGVGATISFDSETGGHTIETLIEKDDVRRIWKIDVPSVNDLFTQYVGTAAIEKEAPGGCIASYTFEGVLASPNINVRKSLVAQASVPPPAGRVVQVARMVLRRDGLINRFTLPIYTSIGKLWEKVGDWGNVDWVQGATGVQLITPYVRKISFGSASLEERMVSVDNAANSLVYEIYNSASMRTRMYQGTVKLTPISANATQLTYAQQFIPNDGLNPTEIRGVVADAFLERLAWIQRKFDTRRPGGS